MIQYVITWLSRLSKIRTQCKPIEYNFMFWQSHATTFAYMNRTIWHINLGYCCAILSWRRYIFLSQFSLGKRYDLVGKRVPLIFCPSRTMPQHSKLLQNIQCIHGKSTPSHNILNLRCDNCVKAMATRNRMIFLDYRQVAHMFSNRSKSQTCTAYSAHMVLHSFQLEMCLVCAINEAHLSINVI